LPKGGFAVAKQEYVCIRKCYWGTVEKGRPARPFKVYDVGDPEFFDSDTEKIPEHFALPAEVPPPPSREEEQRAFQMAVRTGVRAPIDEERIAREDAEAKKALSRPPIDAIKADEIARAEALEAGALASDPFDTKKKGG
jgi:hypothetical protein